MREKEKDETQLLDDHELHVHDFFCSGIDINGDYDVKWVSQETN